VHLIPLFTFYLANFTVPGSQKSILFFGERGFASCWRTRLIFYTIYVENNLRSQNPHSVWRGAPSTTSKGRCQIFAMQRRRACICGHGTGGGGTCPPPLGTTTHRYIFPYCLFGRCTDIHAIWVLAVVLHPSNMSGSRTVSSCRT